VFAHDSPYEAYEQPHTADGHVRSALRVLFWLEDSLQRDVVVTAIERVEGIELVLATNDGAEVLEVVGRGAVDLVAFDADAVSMAQVQRSVEVFRAAAPEVRLVALTSSSTATSIRELLAVGVDGAISKSILTADFGHVLRQSGRTALVDSVAPPAAAAHAPRPSASSPSSRTSIAS
jgi:DNA-binding NarL/FixJ family response regulator